MALRLGLVALRLEFMDKRLGVVEWRLGVVEWRLGVVDRTARRVGDADLALRKCDEFKSRAPSSRVGVVDRT